MLGNLMKRAGRAPVCIVDVEGGSVAVAIAVPNPSGAAHVLISERAYLSPEERTRERAARLVSKLISEVGERVIRAYSSNTHLSAHGAVEKTYVIVGSPFSQSRSVFIQKRFPETVDVTQDILQGLAKEALQGSSNLDPAHLLETSIIRVQLNGYPTAQPVGKKARIVSVTAFQSDIMAKAHEGIVQAVQALLPGREIVMRSNLRAVLTVLHEHIADTHHYLVISVGSQETMCVAVRKEQLSEQALLEEGSHTVITRLAGENGLPDEILSLLRMVMSDACSTPACESVKQNLARIEPELVKRFGEVFATLAKSRRIPNTCILVADAHLAPWLEYFFSRIDFSQFTITTQPLSVESLSPDHIRSLVTWAEGTTEDTAVGLAASFVNKYHQ